MFNHVMLRGKYVHCPTKKFTRPHFAGRAWQAGDENTNPPPHMKGIITTVIVI